MVKSENKVNMVYCYSLVYEFWLNVEYKNGIVYVVFCKGLIYFEVLDLVGCFFKV